MSPRKILLVEDSPTQAEHLRLVLEGAGYQVEVAEDGVEGLRRLRAAPPDLVLSDVMMPRLDGYGLCHAIKSRADTRHIPVVLVTGRKSPLDIVKALERGADNFITKPVDEVQLLDRLRRIFEHAERRQEGALQMEFSLRLGERAITITADTQQIVEMLFASFEELCRLNEKLEAAKAQVECHAQELEETVEARTRELRLAERSYRTLVEHLPATTYVARLEGGRRRLLYVGPQVEGLLGLAAAAVLAEPDGWEGRLHPEDGQRVAGEVARCRGSLEPFTAEYRMLGDGGREVWVRDAARWVEGEEDEGWLLRGFITDISDRKRVEAELEQSREAAQHRERLALMGELLAGVAHELNNPLSVVIGQSGLLKASVGEGPLAQRVERIVTASQRCARIVRNFLSLARQEPPERERVALDDVARETLEMVGYQLRVAGIEVSLDLVGDLPFLWADPQQLGQVLVNLLTNAQHALRGWEGPRRITVATRHDASRRRAFIEVADTGPGMRPEIQERIFEPFFTTKPPGEGTGLGLPLCRGMVGAHGGAISVASEPGQGAIFTVELPVEPISEAPGSPRAQEAQAGRGARILVVDDEPMIAELLMDMLSGEGHAIDTAANGQIALERLESRPYDLVLCDLKMPVLDGPGLFRALSERRPELARRMVFITGDSLNPAAADFLKTAGVPFLMKPVEMREVQATVRRLLAAR